MFLTAKTGPIQHTAHGEINMSGSKFVVPAVDDEHLIEGLVVIRLAPRFFDSGDMLRLSD